MAQQYGFDFAPFPFSMSMSPILHCPQFPASRDIRGTSTVTSSGAVATFAGHPHHADPVNVWTSAQLRFFAFRFHVDIQRNSVYRTSSECPDIRGTE